MDIEDPSSYPMDDATLPGEPSAVSSGSDTETSPEPEPPHSASPTPPPEPITSPDATLDTTTTVAHDAQPPKTSADAPKAPRGPKSNHHERNLAFIQRLAEQKKQTEPETLHPPRKSSEPRGLLNRSQSVLVRGEPSSTTLNAPTRRERGPRAKAVSPALPGEALTKKRDANSAGDRAAEGPSASSSTGAPNNDKFQGLYMIYIQQLAEKKKQGREHQAQAKEKAVQNREKLKQKVLKQLQEHKPRRPWLDANASSESFRLPPLHGSHVGLVRRSMDDSSLGVGGNPSRHKAMGSSMSATAGLSPYLSPALMTRMATGNALAVGGGVNLVEEAAASGRADSHKTASAASVATTGTSAGAHVSGAVRSLDACFEGHPQYGVWRSKWRIPEGAQVFSMGPVGKHSEGIRSGLLRRGWIETPTPNAGFYNLLWSIRCGDIDFKALRADQVVNHFQVASCITTKVGLLHSLRELPWFDAFDPESFYPRAYDLFRDDGRAEFQEDFRWTAAESLVKRVAATGRLEGMSTSALAVAVRVCESRVAFERDLREDDLSLGTPSDGALRPQSRAQSRREARPSLTSNGSDLGASPGASPSFFHFTVSEPDWALVTSQPALRMPPPMKAMGLGAAPPLISAGEAKAEEPAPDTAALLLIERCRTVAAELEKKLLQTHINGYNNVWIVKPSGKSRGRGIRLFNDYVEMMRYIGPDSAEAKWIVQKYIERPMLAHRRRKFDFRQWVLVTDWNPITCYFYSESYVRFAATDYDATDLGVFAHLSNNSIVKDYDGYKKGEDAAAHERPVIHDYLMWSQEEFCEYLGAAYGSSAAWKDKIQPQMKAIVRATLRCATDMVKTRKNSVQLYGYDFMLDDQLGVWLLEVNASPTMEASTPVTQHLCRDVQEDILKVIVDLPQYRATKKAAKQVAKKAAKEAASAADGAAFDATAAALRSPRKQPRGLGSVAPISEGEERSDDEEEDEGLGARAEGEPSTAGRPPRPEHPEFETGKWELLLRDKVEVKAPKYTGLNLELIGCAIGKPTIAKNAKPKGPVPVPPAASSSPLVMEASASPAVATAIEAAPLAAGRSSHPSAPAALASPPSATACAPVPPEPKLLSPSAGSMTSGSAPGKVVMTSASVGSTATGPLALTMVGGTSNSHATPAVTVAASTAPAASDRERL